MKKEQKIIELRRAAKLMVEEIETKIAAARSEAAEKRANIMIERAEDLDGLASASTERFDVLARYRAKLSVVDARLAAKVTSLKAEIHHVKSEHEKMCAAVEDDHEPSKEQQQQQETVYCDGSEHSARIVARRLINKMPHISKKGFLYVHVVGDFYDNNQEYFVSVYYGDKLNHETEIFSAQRHTAELEASFVEKVRRLFEEDPESGNSHVAEPMARALDAVFGGNPVKQVFNIISDTVKSGKEGGNE